MRQGVFAAIRGLSAQTLFDLDGMPTIKFLEIEIAALELKLEEIVPTANVFTGLNHLYETRMSAQYILKLLRSSLEDLRAQVVKPTAAQLGTLLRLESRALRISGTITKTVSLIARERAESAKRLLPQAL